jgi:glycosyltransferase involved in cell wall biosynthesis
MQAHPPKAERGNPVKISVIIPAYNAATTIRATLDSVLGQTIHPHEILVMDDGSKDDTPSILDAYKSRITVFRQTNAGLSKSRNALIDKARGDLIAFLDADDLWHPKYLEVQQGLFERYSEAAAFFTADTVFYENENFEWAADLFDAPSSVELIDPVSFLKRYNRTPGLFYPSCCCVSRRLLERIGTDPFQMRRAEDCYFCNLLPFYGPIVRSSAPLMAYCIREGSLSSDVVNVCSAAVHGFELLEERYRTSVDPDLSAAFWQAFALRRRDYAKALLGARRIREGRQQLWKSMDNSRVPISLVKSLGALFLTYMPRYLQPEWRPNEREQNA